MKLREVHFFVLFIAVLFSLPTLWFLESQIKYPLFCFETIFIVLLTAKYLDRPRFSFKCHFNVPLDISDCFFALVSIGMFLTTFFEFRTFANILLAILTTSFLPGYVLLRTTNLFSTFSSVEKITLSYVLSLPVTSFISSILLPITSNVLTICSFYLLLSLVPIVISRLLPVRKMETSVQSHDLVEIFLLISLVLFFFLWITVFYPRMAYLPGLDIVRHFAAAVTASKTPEFLWSPYPWFTLYQATFYTVSTSSMMVFQTYLACLSIIVIFSFYIMSKAYLKKIDKRLPIITTVCWSIFSGFGWVFFIVKKLTSTNLSPSTLLYYANQSSYWDIQSSLDLWLWFRPMTIGFAILFVLFYLLKRFDIPKWRFRILFSVLLTTLALFHLPELILFVAFLTSLAVLYPKIRIRIRDAVISTTIGIISMIFICSFLNINAGTVRIPSYAISALIVSNVLAYPFLLSRWNGVHRKSWFKVGRLVGTCFLALYIGGLLTWLFSNKIFDPQTVSETLFVPWLIYPVLLGVIGLLCLIRSVTTTDLNELRNETTVVFVCLLLLALVIGRGISIVNLNLFQVEFHERRSILYLFTAAVMIAFPIIIKRNPSKATGRLRNKKVLLSTLLMGSVVFGGMTSTLLCADFWVNAFYSSPVDETELSAMTFLSSVLEKNPRSPILTITDRSMCVLDFAGSQTKLNYFRSPVWVSKRPEIPLTVLLSLKYPSTYVYLHQRDIDVLNKSFKTGYLSTHLLRYIPEIFSNSMTKIYEMPSGVPPSLNSKMVLVIPSNSTVDSNLFFSYDILSFGMYNYTTKMDCDYEILKSNYIVFPFDKSMFLTLDIMDSLRGQEKNLIILNANGYGPFANLFFEEEFLQEPLRASRITGLNANIQLPVDISVDKIRARDNVEVLGWYESSNESAPFAARLKVDKGKIVYINIHPLIKRLVSSEENVRSLYVVLKELFSAVDLNLPKYDLNSIPWLWNDDVPLLVFKEAILTGDVNISSSSIFLNNSRMLLKKVEIVDDSTNLLLRNVSSLTLKDFAEATISNHAAKMEGTMFYLKLDIDSANIFLTGENISVYARSLNGESVNVTNRQELKLSIEGQSQLFVFQPQIKCVGKASFNETYAIHPGINWLRTLGQELKVEGHMELNLTLSDGYGIAQDLTFNGSYERNPPILQWNELKSFIISSPFIAWVSTCTVASILIKRKLSRKHVRARNNSEKETREE